MIDLAREVPRGLAIGIEKDADLPMMAMQDMYNKMMLDIPEPGRTETTVNEFNLTMPTSNSPADIATAFDIMKASIV